MTLSEKIAAVIEKLVETKLQPAKIDQRFTDVNRRALYGPSLESINRAERDHAVAKVSIKQAEAELAQLLSAVADKTANEETQMSKTEREMVAIEIDQICDSCAPYGRMRPVDGAVLMCKPPKYEHKCNYCGHVEKYLVRYPHIVHRPKAWTGIDY